MIAFDPETGERVGDVGHTSAARTALYIAAGLLLALLVFWRMRR